METTGSARQETQWQPQRRGPFRNVIGIFISFFIVSYVILSTSFCFRLCERCLPLRKYRFVSFCFLSVREIISTVRSESAATDSLFSYGPESKFQWSSETDFQVFTPGRQFSLGFLAFLFFSWPLALASFSWTPPEACNPGGKVDLLIQQSHWYRAKSP